jgi:hypothetical protein
LAALDSSPKHGQAPAEVMREVVFTSGKSKAAEMRKEMQRVAAVADRLNHYMLQLSAAGRIDELPVQRDIVELAG